MRTPLFYVGVLALVAVSFTVGYCSRTHARETEHPEWDQICLGFSTELRPVRSEDVDGITYIILVPVQVCRNIKPVCRIGLSWVSTSICPLPRR